jgi:hypothetical protein
LGELVRAAFDGIADNLYDHIHYSQRMGDSFPDEHLFGLKDVGFAFPDELKFLSTSRFQYGKINARGNKKWSLEIDSLEDYFGAGMLVYGVTPRDCVLGMIAERKKFLQRDIKKLKKFDKQTRSALRVGICYA